MHGTLNLTGDKRPYKTIQKNLKNIATVSGMVTGPKTMNEKACSKRFHARRTKSWRNYQG